MLEGVKRPSSLGCIKCFLVSRLDRQIVWIVCQLFMAQVSLDRYVFSLNGQDYFSLLLFFGSLFVLLLVKRGVGDSDAFIEDFFAIFVVFMVADLTTTAPAARCKALLRSWRLLRGRVDLVQWCDTVRSLLHDTRWLT